MPWLGGGSTPVIKGAVETFPDLPNVIASEGQLWFVKNPDRTFFPKEPRGIYYSDGVTWEITPIKVKWSEDAGSILNWINWSDWYTGSEDISLGDVLLYNDKFYKNLTGIQTGTAPDTDTTNWDHYFPQGTISVALTGGDFSTIKEACESITDSALEKPYFIQVHPCCYEEDPFVIPPYTTVFLNNARVKPKNLAIDFIGMDAESVIRNGGIIDAPTNGATFYTMPGASVVCSNIRLIASSPGQQGTGYLAKNGGTLTASFCIGSGLENAYWADSGGLVVTSCTASDCVNGIRCSNFGQVLGGVFGSISNVDIHIKQDSTTALIRMADALINIDRIQASNWNNLYLTVVSDKEDDEAFVVTQELHVGTPELGQETAFGEGDSYTRGMLVYTETDLGVFTDVSAAARSASGSTFTFTGLTPNNSIYVASSLSNIADVIEHFGIKSKVSTAVVLGSGEVVVEYWNGSTWIDLEVMEVESSGRYFPNGNNIFQKTGSHHIRYNSYLAVDTWTKNDPMSLGTNYYWIRYRIDTTITTAPIFEQWKLHTNHKEDNADGWVEYFGKARPLGQLNLDFAGARPFEGNMQSQAIYVNEDVAVGFTQNKFTLSTDKTGLSGFLPFDFDTSSPLILQWSGRPTNTQTIEWTVRVDWVTDNGSDLYYLTEPALSPGRKVVVISKAITAAQVSMFEARIDLREMISRRDGAFGDELWISIQPSALSGTFSLTSGQAVYTKWCDGGHI